jgi:tryptophan synthase alpha chain
MSRIQRVFERTRRDSRVALFPYLTDGFPDRASCSSLIEAMLQAGADGLEIGIPFSDPVADGLTLQRASEQALRGGASIATALETARRARRASAAAPLIYMSYLNPILAAGERAFCQAAADAGADGLIVPDLPPEECESVRVACQAAGLDYIMMLAPTSSEQRIKRVAELASGFIYCVSLVGVTGARDALYGGLAPFLSRIRAVTSIPLVVGFGISQPEHVRSLRGLADGAIVASALADLIERTAPADRPKALYQRVREMVDASASPRTLAG